jgi:HK97 gp10 family phage protein
MFEFKIDASKFLKGVDKLQKDLSKRIEKWLYWGLMTIQRDAMKNLKPWNPPLEKGVDTGRLRASIIYEKHPFRYEGRVGPTGNYAKYLEFGTRPRLVIIPAIKDEAFRISMERWWRRHIGTSPGRILLSGKPYPFLRTAFEKNRGKIYERLKEILKL